ncbi:hypothetical protein EIN_411420 [Entamoeba invadens IP1]|uniref:Uncharacterized protein n=1 Tax=Entamoeba invadens IP1 TaxID=370355 RepID=A0A0A1U738_ENTIV|nr:hypothetical protein EIN_411420 [Entamoeba invadens IP1]ELP87789.1 hypothetical protein EIN_411420 [Entamoeba invadens IP1]|eukprot:XP_004254560.1 hypothetical protein EIN_411420 [Entamoeba invadens IP1]
MFLFVFLVQVYSQQCLVRQMDGVKNYYEVVQGTNLCPCDGCSYEIADCLQAPLDLTQNFVNLVAHCPQVPKKMYPLNITQQKPQQITATNTFLTFNSLDTVVSKLVVEGDIAIVMKKGKFNVFEANKGETNVTIPKCKTNCSIQMDSATFSALNDWFIGSHNLVDIKALTINCSKTYPSSIHIGVNSKIHAQKVVIQGNTVIFTEGHKMNNMSGPLILSNEFVTTRPLSIQVIDKLHPQQCVLVLQSNSLKKFPKTMQFKIDQNALNFAQFAVKFGELNELSGEGKHTYYTVKGNKVQQKVPEGYKMSVVKTKYVVIPNQVESVYPVDDLDQDYFVNKTILQPEEKQSLSEILLIKIDSQKHIKLYFKNYKKYGIMGKKFGKKGKMTYHLDFDVTAMKVDNDTLVLTQQFKKKSDIVFPIEGDEVMTIPSHYFTKRNKYPLKNYEVWKMEDDEYLIMTKKSVLNMFSFYTDSDYRLARVDDQLLICNPRMVQAKQNATAVNGTGVEEIDKNENTLKKIEESLKVATSEEDKKAESENKEKISIDIINKIIQEVKEKSEQNKQSGENKDTQTEDKKEESKPE